ncbi:hypothetical protein EI171_30570 [Bradyrhizobium sp. LCT2]|uniref:hypothetical protein n=1 Tax=Bradyrhizobium sp. LCT2 TaxID=2493093 RepID=UPI0013744AA0|nr:hypothetical protein [Bradyrhizobium sp. LCT2]QHP71254.1 hypothetical protein EI171_30570 [Bradyrhizobium sp. LCT2]
MMRLARIAVQAVSVFGVVASNLAWHWGDNYLACAIAVGLGFVARAVFDDLVKRIAYRRMRGLYGQEWNTEP